MSDLKVFTVEEVAEILRVSKQTVMNYIKLDKIKTLNTDGAVRISSYQLENFLKGE